MSCMGDRLSDVMVADMVFWLDLGSVLDDMLFSDGVQRYHRGQDEQRNLFVGRVVKHCAYGFGLCSASLKCISKTPLYEGYRCAKEWI